MVSCSSATAPDNKNGGKAADMKFTTLSFKLMKGRVVSWFIGLWWSIYPMSWDHASIRSSQKFDAFPRIGSSSSWIVRGPSRGYLGCDDSCQCTRLTMTWEKLKQWWKIIILGEKMVKHQKSWSFSIALWNCQRAMRINVGKLMKPFL